jgi:hypothetical protein
MKNSAGEVMTDLDGNELQKPVLVKKDDGSIIVQLDHCKCRTNILRYELAKYLINVFSI